jgi:hypothetical protein
MNFFSFDLPRKKIFLFVLQSIACFAGLIEFTGRLFDEPGSKEQSGSKRKRKAVNEDHQKIDCKTKKKVPCENAHVFWATLWEV